MTMQPLLSTPLGQPIKLTTASLAFSMTSTRFYISILDGVLMTLRAMRLACLLMCTVSLRIVLILTWSTPIQIFQMVVIPVIIAMQGPHSRGAWTDKGCENNTVNRNGIALAVTAQDNLSIYSSYAPISAPLTRFSLSQYPSPSQILRTPSIWDLSGQGSYTPMSRHFISRKIGNRNPFLSVMHSHQFTTLHGGTAP